VLLAVHIDIEFVSSNVQKQPSGCISCSKYVF